MAVNLRSPPTGNDCTRFLVLRATIFLTGAPILSLGTTKLAVQRVLRGLFPGIRRPRRVAKHTVSCTAKANAWRYSTNLHILLTSIHLLGLVLNHRDKSSLPVCHL